MSDHVWPERLTLRDTNIHADEGQRIYTTATGYGYEKCEYVRADASSQAEIERLKAALGAIQEFATATRLDPQANVPAIRHLAEAALSGSKE